jgi:RNA polymerase sigma factor (sigma-70 family)
MQLSNALSAEDIFYTVYKECRKPFSEYADRILGDTEEARDALSDIFVIAWKVRESFQTVDNMKSFVWVCTRNRCLKRLRSLRCRQSNQEEVLNRYYNPRTTEVMDIFNDSSEPEIMRAINSLDLKYQECILLFYFEKMTCSKIAQRLNIKERNVRYFLTRGRVLIKSALETN